MSDQASGSSSDGTRRTFILDTNVLLYDPRAIFVFHEHDVVIPMTVIEEIDRFKKDLNETGRNARQVSRYLDELRAAGSLHDMVTLPGGGRLGVDFVHEGDKVPISWGPDTNDNRILATALRLNKRTGGKVVLVTRDTNMRLKGDALGVQAEDYEHAHIDIDEQYMGVTERVVPKEVVDEVYQTGTLSLEHFSDLRPQQFVILQAEGQTNQTAMTRVDQRRGRLRLVHRYKEGIWGIFARNKEQLFALNLLMDDDIHLVTLNGVAGTGKTLLALACGLAKVCDDHTYRKMLVSRPIFPLGRDIGFLPGDIEQKLNPWMKPIFDNLDLLVATHADPTRGGSTNGNTRRGQTQEPQYQSLIDQKMIEVEPLTYIRGRSIPNQYLIIDEAQNLTPHEVKTVLTRAGEGTKVILTGDPYQIDNPYVDALSNGLTYTVERFKDSPVAGHVTLTKGERSELAELAAQLL